MNLPWVEKYRPKKLHQLKGNDSAINSLYIFLKKWTRKKSPPGVILLGPAGSGKTSSAYVVANELGYDITEVNASDTRTKKKISEGLSSAFEFMSLDSVNNNRLILFDEVDGLSGQKDRGGLNEFLKLAKKTLFPIVATANDEESDKIDKLVKKGKFRLIKFERLDEFEILELLLEISSYEKMEVEESAIEAIAENSAGDLRAAINELESLNQG